MKKILVVDDDPSFRELLIAFLEDKGYWVESAADGRQALRRLRSSLYDLVLLDLQMPRKSGLDLLRTIEAEDIDTKVIAISGHQAAAEHLGPAGIKLGAEVFLSKPVDLEELEMTVASQLSPRSGAEISVLVADDDPSIREILRAFLEEKRYRVLTAADGEEALESVRTDQPEIMFLDLYMPKLSGVEVLKRIRDEGHEVGIITISGTHDEAAARATFELGAADFIAKPFDLEYLELSLLSKIVGLSS